MAGIIPGALRAYGSQESDEGLQRISLYLYGLHIAFEDMLVHYPADSESLYKVHAQVSRSVFDQALLSSEMDGANKWFPNPVSLVTVLSALKKDKLIWTPLVTHGVFALFHLF